MAKLPPRIVITGTHGVGKSTLVAALCAHYRQRGVVTEVAREFGRRYIEYSGDPLRLTPASTNPSRQVISLFHDVQEEFRAAAAGDLVICDRGVVDSLAYSEAVGITYDAVDLKFARGLVHEHARGYDLVIYLPVEFALADDGVRMADVAFQKFMDEQIYKGWRDAGVSPVMVRGTEAQRLAQAVRLIDAVRGPINAPRGPQPG
ncbi:MAG: ATP-binding protein [Alphaproteobacteria bacterium]|nr:ATP-binding protein [Alphaproteobacteria bacterium]